MDKATLRKDKTAAAMWAKEMLDKGCVIMDTETTGLDVAVDEPVEIAAIDHMGRVLLNQRLSPSPQALARLTTKGSKGKSAFDIHGIGPEQLEGMPPLIDFETEILSWRPLVVYNAQYDVPLVHNTLVRQGSEAATALVDRGQCAMMAYAAFIGEIKHHRTYNGAPSWSYKWHPLVGGDHSALGDCFATLEVLKRMARYVS